MERIAVVGTGVAGLGAAWNLRDAAQVTLFEQDARAGGHSNTVTVREGSREVPIDTGFIVFNRVTYPHLCRLFEDLGVATQPSEMSFSVQHLPDGLEYNGMGVRKVFAQKRNLFRPRFHRLLGEITRFFAVANAALIDPPDGSVRDFAAEHGFGPDFLEYYLVPMSSAVWSTRPEDVLEFPAGMLIRFFYNHGFLGVRTHHPWFTVSGGARSYVRKIIERTTEPRLGAKVVGVATSADAVTLRLANGGVEKFDRVIIAAHADQALAMLVQPTDDEARLLGAFRYQANQATLHTDATVMPRRRVAWASWNYRIQDLPGAGRRATTHYWMNALQNVSRERDYFVSINARGMMRADQVLHEVDYDHPTFTLGAMRAQRELGALNRRGTDQRVYFCGSYFRYGFHEDAYWSAVEVAGAVREHLGVAPLGSAADGAP